MSTISALLSTWIGVIEGLWGTLESPHEGVSSKCAFQELGFRLQGLSLHLKLADRIGICIFNHVCPPLRSNRTDYEQTNVAGH